MQYCHKESVLLYMIGPIILIIAPLLIWVIVDNIGVIVALLCLLLFIFGILSFFYERKKSDRIWELRDGLLITPDLEIELSEIIDVERVSFNDEIFFDLKVKKGDPIRTVTPYFPRAESKLLSVLKQSIKEEKGDIGENKEEQ